MQQNNDVVLQRSTTNLPGPKPGEIVVNEVAPAQKNIEFYNTSDHDISLVGCVWKGVDEAGVARPDYVVSENDVCATISSHGYGVWKFKSADNISGPSYGLSGAKHWSFEMLDASGVLVITFSNTFEAEGLPYIIDTTGVNIIDCGSGSFGRFPDGSETWKVFTTPTIGKANEEIVPDEPKIDVTPLSVHTGFDTKAESLSGLTFGADKSILYGVGDKGTIYEMSFIDSSSNMTTTNISFNSLDASFGTATDNGKIGDFEAITYSTLDNKFYILNERPAIIYTYDNVTHKLDKVATFEDGDKIGTSKNGFEGLTYNEKQKFFIGHQDTATLYKFNLKDEIPTLKEVKNLSDYVTEIADLYFDGTNIYVLDSKECTIIKCDSIGNFISKYSLSFLTKVDNPEALAIDDNIAYVGCDNGDTGNTKNVYKVLMYDTISTKTIVMNEFNPNKPNKQLELYNTTDSAIDLNGYSLYKDDKLEEPFVFDSTNLNTLVPAKSRIVVPVHSDGLAGPSFGMSDDKGFDYKLFNTSGQLIDHVDNLSKITYIPSGMSYGRKIDGSDEFVIFSTPSIGKPNSEGVIYNPTPVEPGETIEPGEQIKDRIVINECGQGKQIELYNPTSEAVDLTGAYALIKVDETGAYNETYIDDDGVTKKEGYWVFRSGNTIQPNDRIVVAAGSGNLEIGPTFGLNITKKFKLFLYKVTSTTNYSTLETIGSTATLIDEFNNYDNKSSVTDKKNDSIGRVNDGTTNLCCFRGGTIGKPNNEGVKYAWSNTKPDTPTASKEVAYWVKDDEEYIYYPIFYDNDSILSLNNTGYSLYAPNVESTDKVGSGYAFNGAESVLWLNLKDAFADRISELYARMRTNGLTYSDSLHFFTETQSKAWSESVYNMDAKFKYIEPATVGYIDFSTQDNTGAYGVNVQDSYYLYECQGSRESHRSWWLSNRFNYMDSRYNTGEYHDSFALFRLYTPTEGAYNPVVEPDSTFRLTPYSDMYLRVRFGSIDGVVRAEKNKTYEVKSGTADRYNDTETMVYGAQYLLSMGDLSDKYTRLINLTTASRINDLTLGHDSPYFNDNLTNLSFGPANTALRNIDVRNCRNLNVMEGLDNLVSLETLLATNTAMSTFSLPTNGCNLKNIEYPKTLTTLKLIDMPYITTSGIKFESYSNIESIWIEKCPALNTWSIINNILMSKENSLHNLRITGINWNITTTEEFKIWQKVLSMKGMNANGAQGSYKVPYLSGIVNISHTISISTGYKESVMNMINELPGASLTITGGHEESISGIKISGPESLTPNVWYTFSVSYLPDDYVIESERGVVWNLPAGLEKRNETANSVELRFIGSASGTETFVITAVSKVNNEYTASLSVRPSATLNAIRLYDVSGNEVDYEKGISVYEGESIGVQVRFTPEDTTDKDITISFDKPGIFEYKGGKPYEYSENTNLITLTGAEVSTRQTAIMTISSKNVANVVRSLQVNVLNVVSRIIKLQDATSGAGIPVEGYADIKIDGDNGGPYRMFSTNGEIKIQTNKEYHMPVGSGSSASTITFRPGFNKLVCECHANTENEVGYLYNKPEDVVFAEIAETAPADITSVVSFYKPVKGIITIKNGGNLIKDANLMITSKENTAIRPTNMNKPPYNNVMTNGKNPVEMYLLANTTHNISIIQVDDNGQPVVNKKYSDFAGIAPIGFGIESQDIEFNISRDYLGESTKYDESEIHLTITTGAGDYRTVRIYYENESPIYINWGDRDEQGSAYQTFIPDKHVSTVDSKGQRINGEAVIYHTYLSNNKEYEISVKSDGTYNTKGVKWFHVISQDSDRMLPCIGTGNTASGFSNVFGSNQGGLVAYQFIGQARMNKPLRFNMPTENDKQYSKLVTIGDIYRNNIDMTNADDLFANTTLEQIPTDKSIFRNNKKITSFNRTFKNTNITVIAANFFYDNTVATSFEETFANCSNLSNIQSGEDIQFLFPAEDVEITSVKNMFLNCGALVSEVPAFWKTFYGCSFADPKKNPQNSFKGCGNIKNIESVPSTWGGYAATPDYQFTSEAIPLKYLKLPRNKYGTFELTNITLQTDYKYVIDVTIPENKPYEIIPIFGSGYLNDPTNEHSIAKVIDFNIFGTDNGKSMQTCTDYLTYRLGDSNLTSWNVLASSTATPYKIFENLHGERVVIDICYSTIDRVIISAKSKTNNDGTPLKLIGVMKEYSEIGGKVKTNTPVRLFSSYAVNVDYLEHLNVTSDKYYCSASDYPIIHELKIYSKDNMLLHDLLPYYAIVSGVGTPIFKDVVNTSNNIYVGSGEAISDLEYYKK